MTDYSAFIAITNHHLLPPDSDTLDFIPGSVSYHRFLAQVEKIAATNVSTIVLREKDLEETVYEALAKDCITQMCIRDRYTSGKKGFIYVYCK